MIDLLRNRGRFEHGLLCLTASCAWLVAFECYPSYTTSEACPVTTALMRLHLRHRVKNAAGAGTDGLLQMPGAIIGHLTRHETCYRRKKDRVIANTSHPLERTGTRSRYFGGEAEHPGRRVPDERHGALRHSFAERRRTLHQPFRGLEKEVLHASAQLRMADNMDTDRQCARSCD